MAAFFQANISHSNMVSASCRPLVLFLYKTLPNAGDPLLSFFLLGASGRRTVCQGALGRCLG